MHLIAGETGGRPFYNRNDIDRAIRNAIDDARVSYMLGYYPTHGKWDGRFVKIKVKVNRPDLDIQARTGYYADAKPQLSEKEVLSILEDSALSPLDANAIGVAVRTEPVSKASPETLKFLVDIDPRDISLLFENEHWIAAIDLMLMQQGVEGNVVSKTAQAFDLQLTHEEHDRLERNGLVINHAVQIQKSAHRLRIVVRDSRSGAVGAVTVPIIH